MKINYNISNTRVLTLNSRVTFERFDVLFLYSFFQDICCGTGALGLCLAQVLVCYIIYSKLSNSRALGHFLSRLCFCMWQIYSTLLCVSVQLCATSKPFIYHHINIICMYALFTACTALYPIHCQSV